MPHNLKCPDCGHPVGWDVNRGECPRNMQNFQNDECKARQVVWLKAQVAAALICITIADEALVPNSRAYREATERFERLLKSPL
jgi:hypothetical protein